MSNNNFDNSSSNNVALVTGATSGIGFAIARKLAQANINLIINGLAPISQIRSTISALEIHGIKCLYHDCDLAYPEQISAMVEAGLQTFGKIDILVHNAGIQHVARIEDFPDQKWESIIRVDLIAAFYTSKYIIPGMKKTKSGRIINIASAHGLVASPFKSAYVAAKHGLVGLTKSLALELAEFDITVNSICPGYVETDLLLNQIADTAKIRGIGQDQVLNEVILKPHAIKRLIKADEVANLVHFLLQSQAANITGASLSIDGGWTAQ